MSMVVNTNIQAMNSHRSLKIVSERTEKASEKLSSGLKINRAGDDAAGLAISEKMRSQIKGLNKASSNAQDGVSAIKTAEGALQETHEMLKRMVELTTQAANGTNTTSDRRKIQEELDQLIEEIDIIATRTHFNTRKLLNGDYSKNGSVGGLWLQVGANSMEGISVKISSMTLAGLFGSISISSGSMAFTAAQKAALGGTISSISQLKGSARIMAVKMLLNVVASGAVVSATGSWNYQANGVQVKSGSRISKQIDIINKAIDIVSAERAKLGAVQNRLEHTIKNLDITSENLSSAESRIRDTDMAAEMMEFTQGNVLTQAAQSMLAQANQAPQQVLSLLG